MSSDWDEIQRLAADLQRAQLSGSIQKLSERNCIEIVAKLISSGLIDVVFTTDGKEYLTPQQIQREIRDELYVARGRIGLVELAQTLGLDFSHVEHQAQIIIKQDSRIHLVLGQLVNNEYLDSICDEINENLQLSGSVSISKLTKQYDLPSDFVQEEVVRRIGSIIEGFQDESDPKTILTLSYVSRAKAKVRGALSAITVPTSVSAIVNKHQIPEQLFFSIADELIRTNRINGTITGGKRANKATYTSNLYSTAQNTWVNDFLSQNGYLEYDALKRIGISDAKSFIKKKFGDEVYHLSTSCVGRGLFSNIESSVEEALLGSMWLDVTSLLPSCLPPQDGNFILKKVLEKKNQEQSKEVLIFSETLLISPDLLNKVEATFQDLMEEQAKKDTESKKFEKLFSGKNTDEKIDLESEKSDKKEERRKKAAVGKGGGGTQGRETKTKSTKKKYGKKKDDFDDSDEEADTSARSKQSKQKGKESTQKIEYLSRSQLEEKLSQISLLQECPEELFPELSDHFYPKLTRKFKEMVTELYHSSLSASIHGKKKSHSELQEKCGTAISHIRLFEKGLANFEGNDKKNLEKHLLRTLCTDLVNSIFVFVQEGANEESLTPEKRLKILNGVDKEEAASLLAIHKALGGDEIGAFLDTFEEHAPKACDLFIRKPDKKKDRQLLFNHRLSLIEQLNCCEGSALLLHLSVMLIFQSVFNAMVHASGKFVPAIIEKILPSLKEEDAGLIKKYQGFIMEQMNSGEERKVEIAGHLEQLNPQLKEIALAKRSKAED